MTALLDERDRSTDHVGARADSVPPARAARSVRAIGTTATVVVTVPERADQAVALLGADLADLDAACSRFRDDSELRRVELAGRPVRVGPLLFEALETAIETAVRTAGIVDPTVGSALAGLGYDRDFAGIDSGPGGAYPAPRPAPGWWRLELDRSLRTVRIPAGVHVDLGSSGKAFAADRSAVRIADALDCGVLVNLGGDVAVAGPPPPGGWGIGIAPVCTAPPSGIDEVVALHSGGLATSGTTARTWQRGGRTVHHIVDPWTGGVAPSTWSLVSATAPTCVEANAWSTAAVVWGDDAPGNLARHGVAARLVAADGAVVRVGEWPAATGSGPGSAAAGVR